MIEPTTLYVRHLPSELSFSDREELLKLVGAIRVKVMPDSGKMQYTAFATFSDHSDAKYALNLLHQREVLGRRLIVEFSNAKHEGMTPLVSDYPNRLDTAPKDTATKPSEKDVLKSDLEGFSRKLHGVAPTLGLDYLPSSIMKYKYPPPSPIVIQNIGHALASVPKFYTQVLHLMNKMNLPPPFGPLTPAPPLAEDVVKQETTTPDAVDAEDMVVTSSGEESEYESDGDGENKATEKILPLKRAISKPKIRKKQRKLVSLIPTPNTIPSARPKTDASDVFDSQVITQKKISVKAIEQIHVAVTEEPVGSFGEIEPLKAAESEDEEKSDDRDGMWKNSKFISIDELRRKKLSSREMRTMSIFRNFSPGEPTCRLYIKNLAKQVEDKDLRYVFGRFIDRNSELERNMFDVRLMKEGRMKGQAFVTLANEKQAVEAVKETNGFVLHTKPLVVQFARSAKPKDDDKKNKKK